jgi:hypothetical protein
MEPYFNELENVHVDSELYGRWKAYALTLTTEDIETIVKNGLTYQANSLKSMIREIIGGQPVSKTLLDKIDGIASATASKSNTLR